MSKSKFGSLINLLHIILPAIVGIIGISYFIVSLMEGTRGKGVLMFIITFAWEGLIIGGVTYFVGFLATLLGFQIEEFYNKIAGKITGGVVLKSTKQNLIKFDFNSVISSLDKKYQSYRSSPVTSAIKEVMLDNSKQFDFLQEQVDETLIYVKNRTQYSAIPNNSNFKKAVASSDNIKDILSMTGKALNLQLKGKHTVDIHRATNNEAFLQPLQKLCHTKGLKLTYIDNEAWKCIEASIGIFEKLTADYYRIKKGSDGEQRVNEHLDLYKDVITNLENVFFEADGTTVEADNLVITEKGVFCIETKNYGNSKEAIEITKDGKWKRWKNGREVEMNNISSQHNRHIGIMQRVINQELKRKGIDIPYVNFEPIYCIANDEVEINNYSSEIAVLRPSSIYPYIRNHKSDIKLSSSIQSVIKEIVLNNKRSLKKYPVCDYRLAFNSNFNRVIEELEKKYANVQILEDYISLIEKNNKKVIIENTVNGKLINIK